MTTTGQPLRGSPERLSDFKESYQKGLVRAIAAASGASLGTPDPDPGIDFELTHYSDAHLLEVAALQIQCKATKRQPGQNASTLSVGMKRKRFEYLATANPSIHKILVLTSLPPDWNNWIGRTPNLTELRGTTYWVNLANAKASGISQTSVPVPLNQPFDDIVLCDLLARIGQGGAP